MDMAADNPAVVDMAVVRIRCQQVAPAARVGNIHLAWLAVHRVQGQAAGMVAVDTEVVGTEVPAEVGTVRHMGMVGEHIEVGVDRLAAVHSEGEVHRTEGEVHHTEGEVHHTEAVADREDTGREPVHRMVTPHQAPD